MLLPSTVDAESKVWDEENASAKLWSVYVSEAEKYDRALVESWRGNMDGILIFAGLFSAILTAFIIESYKTLSPDSGDSTVTLLEQISLQIAAQANGTMFVIPAATSFHAPVSSRVCNILWFISLGFSLTSALVATLLEQWARDFLSRANMRSAPAVRARIYSYLYYGLKRFRMHVVVELVPLLLHASLVFFFAGLVAFLIPVDFAVMIVSVVLLVIVVSVYASLTFLPVLWPDSPYRTPLSYGVGMFLHFLSSKLRRQRRSPLPLVYAGVEQPAEFTQTEKYLTRVATEPSVDRTERDRRALVWTCRSLSDDTELELLLEAIPDVLWSPIYAEHIRELIQNPEIRLAARIESLLRSCDSGLLSPVEEQRRKITCLKALWAVASLSTITAPIVPRLHRSLVSRSVIQLAPLTTSARALVRRSIVHSVGASIASIKLRLHRGSFRLSGALKQTLLAQTVKDVEDLHETGVLSDFHQVNAPPGKSDLATLRNWIVNIQQDFDASQDSIIWAIFSEYLEEVVDLHILPDEYRSTISVFDFPKLISASADLLRSNVEGLFNKIAINSSDFQQILDQSMVHYIDEILLTLAELCSKIPTGPTITPVLPLSMLQYFMRRRVERATAKLVVMFGADVVWEGLLNLKNDNTFSDAFMEALWHLASLSRVLPSDSVLKRAVTVVGNLPASPTQSSTLILLRARTIHTTAKALSTADDRFKIMRPTGSVHDEDSDSDFVPDPEHQSGQAQIQLLGDFFHGCASSPPPYRLTETLTSIETLIPVQHLPRLNIPVSTQRHFASGLGSMSRDCDDKDLIRQVLRMPIFKHNSALSSETAKFQAWMTNGEALQKVKRVIEDPRWSLRGAAVRISTSDVSI